MKVSIKGHQKLIASFESSPKMLADHLSAAIEKGAKLVKQRARRTAGSPPIVNTGELSRGVDYRMISRLTARVGADARYSPFVENGRRPGNMPPVAAIERWAQTKIGQSGLGFVIARSISRKGTKAQPFFYPAVDESINDIKSIVDKEIDGFVRSI